MSELDLELSLAGQGVNSSSFVLEINEKHL